VKDNISDTLVIQEAAIKPYLGIKMILAKMLNAKVINDKPITDFKNLSEASITCTAGTCINIKGIDKDKTVTAGIAGR